MRADSLDDVCDALRRIADQLQQDGFEDVRRVSGRQHSGHGFSLEITDPEMNGRRYRAALKLWNSNRPD